LDDEASYSRVCQQDIRGGVSSVRAKIGEKGLHTALKTFEYILSFVVQCRMITSCEAT
jgi:hypothetical protein